MGLNGSGGVDYSPLREYLDCDMIGEIGVFYGLFNHSEFPDYGAKLAVALLKEETRECADRAMEEIVQIPGVIGVSYFHPVGFPA